MATLSTIDLTLSDSNVICFKKVLKHIMEGKGDFDTCTDMHCLTTGIRSEKCVVR
jgi:hypothetical protein